MKNILLILSMVFVVCHGRRILERKPMMMQKYLLPSGAEELRSNIQHSFMCTNMSDGFYADMDNDCQIFHRCVGQIRHSFICGENTVFSQMHLTCVHNNSIEMPCSESSNYYAAQNMEMSGEQQQMMPMEMTTMKADQATQSEDISKMQMESMAKSNIVESPIEAEDEIKENVAVDLQPIVQIDPKDHIPSALKKNEEFVEIIPVQVIQIPSLSELPPVQARKAHSRKTFLFKADAMST